MVTIMMETKQFENIVQYCAKINTDVTIDFNYNGFVIHMVDTQNICKGEIYVNRDELIVFKDNVSNERVGVSFKSIFKNIKSLKTFGEYTKIVFDKNGVHVSVSGIDTFSVTLPYLNNKLRIVKLDKIYNNHLVVDILKMGSILTQFNKCMYKYNCGDLESLFTEFDDDTSPTIEINNCDYENVNNIEVIFDTSYFLKVLKMFKTKNRKGSVLFKTISDYPICAEIVLDDFTYKYFQAHYIKQ